MAALNAANLIAEASTALGLAGRPGTGSAAAPAGRGIRPRWAEAPRGGRQLPEDETLKPVTEAVRALLGVLRCGRPLAGRG